MSEVWRAHDETLDRTVAVKMLSPTADLERFRREARSLAALAHENVMRVFDYGEDAAGPFMALEWLPGGTLDDRLAAGALPPAETARIAHGLAAGLAHLHSHGLVHRDLKPANVLFDVEDRPKLGDFGLVRHALGSGTLTEAGTVLGTAAYISPEQASGEPVGPASDVYSFGVVLFQMLTGSLPFVADDALRLIDLHRREPPPPVERLNSAAPPSLAALTAASLQKDLAARPADGAALLGILGLAPKVDVVPATEQTRVIAPPETRAGSSARLTTGVVLGLVFLAAAGGLAAWAVARPASTAPGVASTGSAGGTQKNRHVGSTGISVSTTGAAPTRQPQTRTGTTRAATTGRTSTAATTRATTAPATTTALTTAPGTTTAPSTTTPATTGSTTAPTTTAATTSTTATTTASGTPRTQGTTTASTVAG
jgi:serine/threonine-protein kinase